tara:strand:+ start:1307 stop:2047 length:741 start_codon:yes stop_codon:yes gene_type:complete
MEWLLQAITVRRTLQASIALQLVTLATSYATWIYEGCDPFMPFISDTDTNPVSGVPFTIGFCASGLLILILAWQYYRLRADWISSHPGVPRLGPLNSASSILAALAGAFTIWIAFTPWSEQLALHLVQAKVIFGGLGLWAILSTVMASDMASLDSRFGAVYRTRRLRTVFTLACASMLGLSVLQYTGASFLDSVHFESYLEMVGVCTDLSIPAMSRAALFEWGMVLGLIAVVETGLNEVSLMTSDE